MSEVPMVPESPAVPETAVELEPTPPNIEAVEASAAEGETIVTTEKIPEQPILDVQAMKSEISQLEGSLDTTKQKLADIREQLGIPPSQEDPPSVNNIKVRLGTLKEKLASAEPSEEKTLEEKQSTGGNGAENPTTADKSENNPMPENGRSAMNKMPEGKKGIVLGVGNKTKFWSEKGWKTLDIDARVAADITADVNELSKTVEPGSQDFLYAEYMKYDPNGYDGAAYARLLQQANLSLKTNGEFIVKSSDFLDQSGPRITIPKPEQFMKLMKEHGFEVELERGPMETQGINNDKRVQGVTYFARKVSEEFKPIWTSDEVKEFSGRTFYERLGVSKDANAEEINTAYKKLMQMYHSDTAPKDSDYNNYRDISASIGEARNALIDPAERLKYDAKLNGAAKNIVQPASRENNVGFQPRDISVRVEVPDKRMAQPTYQQRMDAAKSVAEREKILQEGRDWLKQNYG